MGQRVDLRAYASHYQFWLEDDRRPREYDPGALWDGAAPERHLGVDCVVAVGTGSYNTVPLVVEILDAAPADDSAAHDHIAEASLELRSGRLLVTALDETIASMPAPPGDYRVRVAFDGLDRAQVWLARFDAPRVLKWYPPWRPAAAPANTSGLRLLHDAAAWDAKNAMHVVGSRPHAADPAVRAFLYYDARDASHWDFSYA
jgi:hypothetical protein